MRLSGSESLFWSLLPKADAIFQGNSSFLGSKMLSLWQTVIHLTADHTIVGMPDLNGWMACKEMWFLYRMTEWFLIKSYSPTFYPLLWLLQTEVPWIRTLIAERASEKLLWRQKSENFMALTVLLNISMTNFLMLWKKNHWPILKRIVWKLMIVKSFENVKLGVFMERNHIKLLKFKAASVISQKMQSPRFW